MEPSKQEGPTPFRKLSRGEEQDGQIGLLQWELEEREKKHTEEIKKLDEERGIDFLTGAKNLEFFTAELERSLKMIGGQRKGEELIKEVSLIALDVDHFKVINDTYGHATGDMVLQKVVKTLQSLVRENKDTVARVGGEEFMVILPGADMEFAKIKAEDFRRAIAELEFIDPKNSQSIFNTTCSFGINSSRISTDPAKLKAGADAAVYQAKNSGRNKVEVHSK